MYVMYINKIDIDPLTHWLTRHGDPYGVPGLKTV